ncbi:hypothetical protein ACQKP8_24320 [Photobacterium alginatilyticum]|uniref:hypothetical protein n=1 Tax=Photobacterium alginatilyticum TaxID=1775171 RepID=UPI0040675AE0
MQKPFITNQFMQFYNRQMEVNQAIIYGYGLLDYIDYVADTLQPEVGDMGLDLTLNYPLIRRALTRCLSYLDRTDTTLTEQDFAIFSAFLLREFRDLEQLIDDEFDEYGF